jgi:hypothetical protein
MPFASPKDARHTLITINLPSDSPLLVVHRPDVRLQVALLDGDKLAEIALPDLHLVVDRVDVNLVGKEIHELKLWCRTSASGILKSRLVSIL